MNFFFSAYKISFMIFLCAHCHSALQLIGNFGTDTMEEAYLELILKKAND